MQRRYWFTLFAILAIIAVLVVLISNDEEPQIVIQTPVLIAGEAEANGGLSTATSTVTQAPPEDTAAPTATEPVEATAYPTPTITSTPERAAASGYYVVQAGDTLLAIAYDLGITFEELLEANPQIDSPNMLHPDDVLRVPLPEGGEAELEMTITLQPAAEVTAYVSAEGGRLLLREEPDPGAPVIALLGEQAPLRVLGRTEGSEWLEVEALPSGLIGWVIGEWVIEDVSLAEVPITGETIDATRTPTITPTQPTPHPFATATRTFSGEMLAEYPFLSNVTERAQEIFLRGRLMGNRKNVFSKVGDSITANTAYLYPIGVNDYDLREYEELQPVVDYYRYQLARDNNSFANTSLAAKGGWLVWHVLIPRYADPEICYDYESPLECEYRVVKPSVALIMLGTNDILSTQDGVYEEGMRQVIEISIDMGVIPVVSTIPPFDYGDVEEGRVELFNNIIVSLCEEYEVPIWDYWAVMKPLPNQGLSTDGVHPSWNKPADFTPSNLEYGMAVRNLTALQALDAIWRYVILPETGETAP